MSAGYGIDTSCYDTLVTGRLVTGVELVQQAVFRRFITARGTLVDGPDGEVYGLDLQDFIGVVGPTSAIDALPDAIRNEVLKDDRVASCDVSLSAVVNPDATYDLTITIDANLSDESGDFTLTLSATNAATTLLSTSL